MRAIRHPAALAVTLAVLLFAACRKKSSGDSGGGPVFPKTTRPMDYRGVWDFYHDYDRVCPAAGGTTTQAISPQHEGFHYMGSPTVTDSGDWTPSPLSSEHNIVGRTDPETGVVTFATNDGACGRGTGSGRCITDKYCEGTFAEGPNGEWGGTFQMWR